MFSEVLKDLRNEKGCTQTEVAKACNISTQCISSLEMGTRNPTGSTLLALADFFGVSTDYLLSRNEDFKYINHHAPTAPRLSDEENQLLSLFRGMTHAQKVRFIAYGEGMVGIDIPKFKA